MPTTHTVQSGECLASIAKAYNIKSWKTIYDAPENGELRLRRPNPNVLFEGDEVIIPDARSKSCDCPTDKRHTFVVRAPRWMLRVCMKDEEGHGIVKEPFEVSREGALPVRGRTGRDGLIEVELPADARGVKLKFLGEVFDVKIGMLDPVGRVKGLQARLNNLGFHAGPIDGIVGKKTRRAVYEFQGRNGLKPTGDIDDNTLKKLLLIHDNDSRYTSIEDDMKLEEVPALVVEAPDPGEDPPDELEDLPSADWSEPEGCHHE